MRVLTQTQNRTRQRALLSPWQIGITAVVLLVVGLLVQPMFSSASSMRLYRAASILATDIEYAQSLAMSRQQRHAIVFDEERIHYWIEDASGRAIGHPVQDGIAYVVDLGALRHLRKVQISEVDFDSAMRLEFDYLGCPWNEQGRQLRNGRIKLSNSGHSLVVEVEPTTGFINIR
ncbi:MAG: hypothetical protein ABIG61_13645 [Planctomycetota bacterium]